MDQRLKYDHGVGSPDHSAMRLYTEKSIMENSILELQPKIENNYGYYDFFNLC